MHGDSFNLGIGIADFGLMKGMLSILFVDYQLSLNVPLRGTRTTQLVTRNAQPGTRNPNL